MRLATVRTAVGTRAVKVVPHPPAGPAEAAGPVEATAHHLVDLGAADLGELLARPDWRELAEAASGPAYLPDDVALARPVTAPSKVLCVGLNYASHIRELGMELPTHPTLFPKFADSLVGPYDPIVRPEETDQLDWEVELAVVIGRPARRVRGAEAEAAIAGFTVLNDVSCRDWQFRTGEWLQGKAWSDSTPVGPYLVTPDELPGGVRPQVEVSLTVDGELMQRDTTADLRFDPVELVEYASTILRLQPGDIIATGTPGGVGHGRTPARYLEGGETVVAAVAGIGRCENRVVRERAR